MSPTTVRGLLGLFPRGTDPPGTNLRATTLPVGLPTSLSLREISVAGAGGRGAREGVSGHKSPGDGEGGKRRSRGEERERRMADDRQVGGGNKDNGRNEKDDGTGA